MPRRKRRRWDPVSLIRPDGTSVDSFGIREDLRVGLSETGLSYVPERMTSFTMRRLPITEELLTGWDDWKLLASEVEYLVRGVSEVLSPSKVFVQLLVEYHRHVPRKSYLLLESGDYLLLEDGSKIVLEEIDA